MQSLLLCIILWLFIFLYSLVVSVSFNQSTYIANENDGSVQAVLVLNNSVVTDITIQVRTNNNTATGE